MRQRRRLRWFLLAAGLAAANPCRAGGSYLVRVIVKDFTGARPIAYAVPLYFTATNLYADTTTLTGPEHPTDIIYRTDTRKVWQEDHADKSYLEIDERITTTMSDGINKAIDLLGRVMEKAGLDPGEEDAWRIEESGGHRDILGLPAREHLLYNGDEKVQEVWSTAWTNVAIEAADFGAVRQLALASDKLLSLLAGNPLFRGLPYIPLAHAARLDGYPLFIRQYAGGRAQYDIILRPPEGHDEPLRLEPESGYQRKLF